MRLGNLPKIIRMIACLSKLTSARTFLICARITAASTQVHHQLTQAKLTLSMPFTRKVQEGQIRDPASQGCLSTKVKLTIYYNVALPFRGLSSGIRSHLMNNSRP